ncbi:MAG TPA: Hsp70 family protein, partial [Planctomycetaceae bacterium]|nr:Hsp70 family protein [Planctomycetaceae bacterium]
AAEDRLGKIDRAVITVPTQSSELQRAATVEAGLRAGLKHVDIINEPVAATLCAVLGTEGLWFAELADAQRIMVFDLGGGTFDLSLVNYAKNEVRVIAGDGDMNLGGYDWNEVLLKAVCDQFTREVGEDPRTDPESLQFVALEVEDAKRSLSVRERTPLVCHHAGRRKIYRISREQFEKLSRHLVERAKHITERMLKTTEMGWAHVDMVMMVGGATRMPMIRRMMRDLSGRTINTSLSPDQSIAHGAAYYAGMLLSNADLGGLALSHEATERLAKVRQQSINSRSLGILIRDLDKNARIPYYLVKANTPLPTEATQMFGTVIQNQRRVRIHVIESGATPDQPFVELGVCMIDDLPAGLPVGSRIEVTFRYDEQARVHVQARHVASGQVAELEIVRPQALATTTATTETDREASL